MIEVNNQVSGCPPKCRRLVLALGRTPSIGSLSGLARDGEWG